ncbi:four helix bundle protein [Terrimonas ferruginea]|uniref:four helix bundle protein n=1 Tax=Terrimonas ferruginea TaxID=249 RepID=UPI000403379E|nr:four helix bundle protein [Terrimonas ferruginea]
MQNYKDLKVWNSAHRFVLDLYKACQTFPREEVYGLTSQLKRAAISIPANIAEGCGKKSNAELAHFLNIALGSANEAEYFILLACDLSFIEKFQYERLIAQINEVKAMLIGLITKVRNQKT